MINTLIKLGIQQNIHNMVKNKYIKFIASITLNWEMLTPSPVEIKMPIISISSQHCNEDFWQYNKTWTRNKTLDWKERNTIVIWDNVIVQVKTSKEVKSH